MSEFEFFKQAVQEYNKKTQSDEESNEEKTKECNHTNTIMENDIVICVECGEEIDEKISHSKEWRYYGSSDNKYRSNPNRVQVRKKEERSIKKDVEDYNFSEKVISEADKLYSQVTKGKIYRGNSRKGIVFACIYHAFSICDQQQSHDKLMKIFNIKRKIGLEGLKRVNLQAPKNSPIRSTNITAKHIVKEIMELFQATDKQKNNISRLYDKIRNKSSDLNRARPNSVGAGLVYYWIRRKKKNIPLKDFSEKVGLSELTVNKIAKEIARVLKTPNII